MRWVVALLSLPLFAQPCTSGPKLDPKAFSGLESRFSDQLSSFKDPVDILGAPRAIYLKDFGLTISAEVSLIVTPGIMPFRPQISKEDIKKTHARKIAQLPLLKKAMRDMAHAAALNLAGVLGEPQYQGSGLQVAVVMRLAYLPYEDKTGLPTQLTVQANLKNAAAGQFVEDAQ